MAKMVHVTIDGRQVTVPEGTLVVDAAKQAGIDIPVFCYHPKMEPVGMCRVCLVEIGRPMIDRATGKPVLEADGSPKIQFMPKLETGCTNVVSDGMVVLTASEKASAGQKEIVEFLLTSHPLDCPICDKGGECPLQNLTMAYGSSQSRFLFGEKIHLAKQVPLGELIFLDRERCIQCARCIRFQDEVVGEPVIEFYNRGRSTDIVTFSEPGFDSIFSGNTTDICPVGALTTADFRFGARPWELKPAASVCSQCPVGCNLTFNIRREARSGGSIVIKRAMPRQNEEVNELWICDKGRFASYHYTESADRLAAPLVRKDGKLQSAGWEDALQLAASKLAEAGPDSLILAGGRLSNEDLFNLKQLAGGLGGKARLYSSMGGGELTAELGISDGSNFADMGPGTAILVVASDLHDEAPLWWLRVKQAAERGATVIVASARGTRLDRYASYVIRYAYGDEVQAVSGLKPGSAGESARAIAEAFAGAENAVVLFGSDGLSLAGTQSLAAACADLLKATGHHGRANNGLIGVWPKANDQGAWELGYQVETDLAAAFKGKTVYLAAADPAGDDPKLAEALKSARFVIAQELFLSASAAHADVVLPAQAYVEREGTYTTGERRVQRFYPAVPPRGEARADFAITAELGKRLGQDLEGRAASLVFARIASAHATFSGLSYARLAVTKEQWPIVGRGDMYYGGTAYENTQGLGAHLALGQPAAAPAAAPAAGLRPREDELLAVPVTRVYDRGTTLYPSKLLHQRIGEATVVLHPSTAEKYGLAAGDPAKVRMNGLEAEVIVALDETVATGVALLPRSMGVPVSAPVLITLAVPEKA